MTANKQKNRGLGRGLTALMADVAPESAASPNAPQKSESMIPVDRIAPNPEQPRRQFSEDDLNDLAGSIREKGVIQPLILRPAPDGNGYQIVAGERRWRAAQLAQLHDVPAIIRDYSDTEALEVAIIENIQRADLNPIEEAQGYRDLMDRFGHTQEKVSEALGKSRPYIANLLRLLGLPETVQNLLRDGALTAGHGRALITAENPDELARIVIKRGLSVRETERLAREKKQPQSRKAVSEKTEKDADTKALEADLSAATGMKITIDHKPGGTAGTMTIRYKHLEQLDDLCARLSKF